MLKSERMLSLCVILVVTSAQFTDSANIRFSPSSDIPIKPFQFLIPPSKDFDSSGKGNTKTKPPGRAKTLFSVKNINPIGFDFTKVNRTVPRNDKFSKPVIPLLWVNLPLFDTPVFQKTFNQNQKLAGTKSKNDTRIHTNKAFKPEVKVNHARENPNRNTNAYQTTTVKSVKTTPRNPKQLRGNDSKAVAAASKVNEFKLDRSFSTNLRSSSSGLQFAESKNQEQRKISTNFQPPRHSNSKPVKFLTNPVTTRQAPNKAEKAVKSSPSSPIASDYNFNYSVSESKDVKSHSENRMGNIVRGEYRILEADGYTRVVTYVADSSGFKANVKRIPPS